MGCSAWSNGRFDEGSKELFIANKNEIMITWEEVYNVGYDGLAFDLNQGLWNHEALSSKSFPKAGHRDNYLHSHKYCA